MIRVTVPLRIRFEIEPRRVVASHLPSFSPFPSLSLEFRFTDRAFFRKKEEKKKELMLANFSSGGDPRGSSTRDQSVAGGELPVATAEGDSSSRRVPEPVDHLRPSLRHLAQMLG